ncbi:Protein of unknown function DUF726 [Penicillium capsulatum]|uniref:DUF726 domain protein n=1 Tax=Penicillium capsulatum TaxID=69766 RepID=A0A9W9IKK5_9EURO|nr:Protein of unknown function DUF726 [Penicillium capsulatum]
MSAAGVTVGTSDQPAPANSLPGTQSVNTAGPENSTDNGKENQKPRPEVGGAPDQNSNDTSPQLDDFGLPIRARLTSERSPNAAFDDNNGPNEPETTTPSAPAEPRHKGDTADVKASEEQSGLASDAKDAGEGQTRSENKLESQNTDAAPATPADKFQSESPETQPQPRTSVTKPRNAEISEWSHQRMIQPHNPHEESEEEEADPGDWKAMPALGEFDYYDDYGRLIARGAHEEGDEAVYSGLGGAGKGYTRVQLDEDAQSANSLDEDTSYLFREGGDNSAGLEGEELRDTVSQLQATKDLLNETQKIAYVGVVRLTIHAMSLELAKLPKTRSTRKTQQKALDAMRKWGQAMMGRLYMHMDINSAEQIMIEQLAEHGVQPEDLVRPLMQNARVKNPMAESDSKQSTSELSSPTVKQDPRSSLSSEGPSELGSPPPYEAHENEEPPEVCTPAQMPTSDRIDIDLRWTVLCDLFLVLIADSAYDARSRTLLERVGSAMDVTWLQISRFEKRVTDALEMQEQAAKESWDETEHMEKRRQMSLKQKYMIMGLATVGGGLVIGLSAGLLAPVIGAGLAAGFTTVGISGTSAFLGGAGGTALIASSATLGGSAIGMKASKRRMGPVQTFEYRPLHNNKKLNLIVTVSGWMTGKVDDVRLPYSTVDPIMGDLYSVLWEPEMLRSMGDTINILATEVSSSPIRLSSCQWLTRTLGVSDWSSTSTGQHRPHGFDGFTATTTCPDEAGLLD